MSILNYFNEGVESLVFKVLDISDYEGVTYATVKQPYDLPSRVELSGGVWDAWLASEPSFVGGVEFSTRAPFFGDDGDFWVEVTVRDGVVSRIENLRTNDSLHFGKSAWVDALKKVHPDKSDAYLAEHALREMTVPKSRRLSEPLYYSVRRYHKLELV